MASSYKLIMSTKKEAERIVGIMSGFEVDPGHKQTAKIEVKRWPEVSFSPIVDVNTWRTDFEFGRIGDMQR